MKQSGFSLLEVMVVIVIIALFTAMIAPNIIGEQEDAQLKKAAIDIRTLESALQRYKLKIGSYPTTEQGLDALVSAPTIDPIPRNYPEDGFIGSLMMDPWGNPYQLLSPGEMGRIDIYTNGPDGEAGTEDDIGNWNADKYLSKNNQEN
ncbi:type II secretion system major pseudopilin GspG [Bowmanella sp. JS7-9]|uniref:Type II secretion system core protein G n=1 Tax=Pseudobowmanella zhangzhouensis TaxID=1537679 RepID=A0ABW1XEG8_9ALTE|nr:type II secretion system major pseudopilin GspG [Bowmanella sp. JS7-9]TBX20895.1 general secretion pathway protein GspG [Bowmanella sp. JS7-9]